jgi:hypothetical protein
VAVVHGPIVLGSMVPDPALAGARASRTHIATSTQLPIEEGPKLVGSDDEVIAALQPVGGRPLTFTARNAIQPAEFADLELVPFFRVHDSRYMIYWPIEKP